MVQSGSCKILSLNARGFGVSGPLEIPYTLPGEEVLFERHNGKTFLKALKKKSKARVLPPCPYFERCGGCLLQHMNEATQAAFKLQTLKAILQKHHITLDAAPLITIPAGQRRRLRLEAIKKGGQVFLGLKRFQSHQIINLSSCLVVHPDLSALLDPLKMLLESVLQEGAKTLVFLTKAHNGVDVLIPSEEAPVPEGLIDSFMDQTGVIRFAVNGQVFTREEPFVMLAGHPVAIEADCFLQASEEADLELQRLVLEAFSSLNSGPLVDLFCGRGTLTLALSSHFDVQGYEGSPAAVTALQRAADAFNLRVTAQARDLYENPLTEEELHLFSGAVVNPPRTGLGPQVHSLARSSLPKICYVSCSPESFAQDAAILIKGGFLLKKLTPVDQFQFTPHLEVAGQFERD